MTGILVSSIDMTKRQEDITFFTTMVIQDGK
jgi:hypothetical protein